jgi:outer membrane immunogenic protein
VPAIPQIYNWGGVYFGFNLGDGFGTGNWTDPNDPGGTTGDFNLRGFLVGPTIGANFQVDSFVFGLQGGLRRFLDRR